MSAQADVHVGSPSLRRTSTRVSSTTLTGTRWTTAERFELRRARQAIVLGVLVWAALAILINARYGELAAVLIVGWGGSMVICLALLGGPMLLERVRRARGRTIEIDELIEKPDRSR